MTWNKVNKPSSQTYTNVNAQGKEQYDQPSLSYDDANTFYDGVNQNQWTDIVKPSYSTTWDSLIVSWASYQNPWQSPTWTLVSKPI